MTPPDVKCNTCQQYYSYSHYITKHQRDCERCEICFRCFTKQRIISHRRICGTGRGWVCDRCGNIFSREWNLKDHQDKERPCQYGCGQWVISGTTHERNCPMNPSTNSARPQYSVLGPVELVPEIMGTLPSPSLSFVGSDSSPRSASELDDNFEDVRSDTNESAASTARSSYPALLTYYLPQASKGLNDAKAEFIRLHGISADHTRAKVDSIQMAKILAKVTIGNIISADDYLKKVPSPKGTLILCSEADAMRLFDKDPPQIPILVVGSPDRRRMTIDEFLKTLRTRKTLDVHDFGDIVGLKGYAPRRREAGDVVDQFERRRNGKGAPNNFLNLGRIKDNAIPSCFANRNDYKLIDLTRTDNGKAEKATLNDFDDCVTFQLLATKGAAHLPHVDRHGVYTTAFNEEGRKLWLMWPQLTLEDIKSWRMGNIPDGGIAIYIGEGDMLIQPPNALHSPITLDDCLMTGTMHWHSSHLLDILRYTKAAIEDPGITNEAMAQQFIPKMTAILELWEKDSDAYTWPPQEQMGECFEILEWLKDGCNCKGNCRVRVKIPKKPCTCLARGRSCDDRCHYADEKKECRRYFSEQGKTVQSDVPQSGAGVGVKPAPKRKGNQQKQTTESQPRKRSARLNPGNSPLVSF